MADINLERKRRSGIWGWVIALIVLLIILWAFFGRRREPARTTSSGAVATVVSAVAGTASMPWLVDAA